MVYVKNPFYGKINAKTLKFSPTKFVSTQLFSVFARTIFEWMLINDQPFLSRNYVLYVPKANKFNESLFSKF